MLTAEQRHNLYEELNSIHLELDGDPATTGLSLVNGKIAEIHAHKERVGHILSQAIENEREITRLLNEAKLEHEIKLNKILSTVETVRSQKSQDMRVVAANALIPEEYLKVRQLEIEANDADCFHKIVQSKYNHLEGTNSSVSRQITVIQLQLEIGEIERRFPGQWQASPGSSRTITVKGS
jgi:hypothetical protein